MTDQDQFVTTSPRNPWQPRDQYDPDTARVIRGCLQFRAALLERNPWIQFPQSSCSYEFGERRKALPIGALFLLWDRGEDFTGSCSSCGGRIYGIGFGGVMNVGGVVGVCADCGLRSFHSRGSLSIMANLANTILDQTEFRVMGACLGGCVKGNRSQLHATLKKLGCVDLPSDEWAKRSPNCMVSLSIRTSPPSKGDEE